MSSRFVSKLRREIVTNPKKAGILGLLLVVALWFWAPLVAKWFAKSESNTETPTPAANGAIASSGATASATSRLAGTTIPTTAEIKNKLPARPWRQLVGWIEHDPRTGPAIELGSGRDPFNPPPIEAAKAQQRESAAEEAELTPADAGLVLTSTIVGLGQRVALIAGESYKEGNIVQAVHGKGNFRVAEIRPREVILERNGKQYKLSLPTNEWAARPAL